MTRHAWAERLFALTLRAYPRRFRDEYGAEMTACFRDGVREASGALAGAVYTMRAVAGNVSTGLARRWTEGRASGRIATGVWRLDLRHAVRGVTRRPGLTMLITATLAVGVGANAAVFGTLYSAVLAPLPYPQPDRLVRLYQVNPEANEWFGGYLTLPSLIDFRENARTLSAVAGVYTYSPEGIDFTGSGRPERLRMLRVGADYFDVLGVRPARGRPFRRDEERCATTTCRASEARVAIVSAALAARLGDMATLDGEAYEIVGVMPDGMADPIMGAVDVWLPLGLPTSGYATWQWDNSYLSAIARLAPGRTLEEARAEIEHLSRLQGERVAEASSHVGQVVPLHADVVGGADTLLALLMGAVSLLLLLTLVNVAVLLVARALDRTHEVAVRTALGSPRSRLARQYLFEGLLVAVIGGVAGVLLALPLQHVLVSLAPAGALDRAALAPAWPILASGLGVALGAGLVFGLTPTLGLRRVDATEVLRSGSRGSERRVAARVRAGLVVAQVALALILLIGAGVLVASLQRLQSVELNLRARNVLAFEANLPAARYPDDAAARRFRADLIGRLEALPGVRAAGALSTLPVTGRAFVWGARRAVGENEAEGDWLPTDQRVVAGHAFEALGIPLLAGRVFDPGDDAAAPPRVVANESFARTMFGSAGAAVGEGVRVGNVRREIIGVVADVPVSVRGEVAPMLYHADAQFAQGWTRDMVQLVSTEPGAPPVLPRVVAEVAALDQDLVVYRPRALEDVIGAGRTRERFAARLLTAFAGLAVALSALGLYGILGHAVRRRRREIGIRVALGAEGGSVLRMVVGQGVGVASIGVVLGLAGGWVATRALDALVFGIGVRDARVFAGAAVTMTLVAVAASALPALRATRVNPTDAFRAE